MSDLANDFSDKLDAVLSNPEMMAQIKRLADTMTGAAQGTDENATSPPQNEKSDAQAESATVAPDITEAVSAIAALTGGDRRSIRGRGAPRRNMAHSKALLLALKPYLDEKRCEKIDKLLKMMQLAEMAGYFM